MNARNAKYLILLEIAICSPMNKLFLMYSLIVLD